MFSLRNDVEMQLWLQYTGHAITVHKYESELAAEFADRMIEELRSRQPKVVTEANFKGH